MGSAGLLVVVGAGTEAGAGVEDVGGTAEVLCFSVFSDVVDLGPESELEVPPRMSPMILSCRAAIALPSNFLVFSHVPSETESTARATKSCDRSRFEYILTDVSERNGPQDGWCLVPD